MKKLINFQLAPSMASPHHAALLEQLIYDMHDMVARVSGQEESASSLGSKTFHAYESAGIVTNDYQNDPEMEGESLNRLSCAQCH